MILTKRGQIEELIFGGSWKTQVRLICGITAILSGLGLILLMGVHSTARQYNSGWIVYRPIMWPYPEFLYRMRPDGSEKENLGVQRSNEFEMLTTYGGWVVYCNHKQVYSLFVATKTERRLFDWQCDEFSPTYFDTQWLYFTRFDPQQGTYRLYRVTINGGQQEFVLQNPLNEDLVVYQISPDKEWLYGVSGKWEGNSPGHTLIRFRPDGSDFQVLTQDSIITWLQAWSPNRQWLVFTAIFQADHDGIYLIRPDGSDRWRVTVDGRFITWANNGHEIMYRDFDSYIRAVNILTGDDRLLFPKIALYQQPILSPNRKWLAFVSPTGKFFSEEGNTFGEVHLASTDGWLTRQLTFDLNAEAVYFWSADGQWLYFTMSDFFRSPSDIYRVHPDGTRLELLVQDAAPLAWVDYPTREWNPISLGVIGLMLWGLGSVLLLPALGNFYVSRESYWVFLASVNALDTADVAPRT